MADDGSTTGSSKRGRRNPYQRAIERYDNLHDTFAAEVSNFLGFLNDPDRPCLRFTLSRRDEGGFLAIMVREEDMTNYVMFARSEDAISTIIEASRKLSADKWKEQEPWSPSK